ncbi:MAG: prepilin-type N-terminal cleavage/methylation domain-containing protein [Acidobacteriota bacterium]
MMTKATNSFLNLIVKNFSSNPQSAIRNPQLQQSAIRNPQSKGFTLLELIITITILSILTSVTIPLVRNSVKRERESELRLNLRQLRQAIDAYKRFAELNRNAIPIEWKTDSYYPKNLEILVEGFIPANTVGTTGNRIRFLRRLPIDPMTGKAEWGMKSYKDEPDSTSWGGEDVFDVYTTSDDTALNGTKYKDW